MSGASNAEPEGVVSKVKVKKQIKTIVHDLETILGDLKDVAKELKEVSETISLMDTNVSFILLTCTCSDNLFSFADKLNLC